MPGAKHSLDERCDETGGRHSSGHEGPNGVRRLTARLKPRVYKIRSFFTVCCALLMAWLPANCLASKQKPCVTTAEASKMIDKDVCVSAHIYDVVLLADGTRFLDVCPPATPDAGCRFTIVSFARDRDTVGKLAQYRGRNVKIRGVVRPMHGRTGMVLSHARQFDGGPPRFRPNPKLLRGFNAEQSRPPMRDPNLHTYGGGRTFMNSRDQETRRAK